MSSISDTTYEELGTLGYTGTLADRQYQYLASQSTLDPTASTADMQVDIGIAPPVRDVLDAGIIP